MAKPHLVRMERSCRGVAMPEGVIRALKTRPRQDQERLVAGLDWQDSELVFTNPKGGPLEPLTLHRDCKRLLRAAELPTETRFHDLRHTAASLLLAEACEPARALSSAGRADTFNLELSMIVGPPDYFSTLAPS